mmetsp:Transcript_11173/g.31691  ORF Transcript_11173/g.31691 Transcript_11173/m.31691 type:complete len:210 (-) Transcript_11173:131-760(-)
MLVVRQRPHGGCKLQLGTLVRNEGCCDQLCHPFMHQLLCVVALDGPHVRHLHRVQQLLYRVQQGLHARIKGAPPVAGLPLLNQLDVFYQCLDSDVDRLQLVLLGRLIRHRLWISECDTGLVHLHEGGGVPHCLLNLSGVVRASKLLDGLLKAEDTVVNVDAAADEAEPWPKHIGSPNLLLHTGLAVHIAKEIHHAGLDDGVGGDVLLLV